MRFWHRDHLQTELKAWGGLWFRAGESHGGVYLEGAPEALGSAGKSGLLGEECLSRCKGQPRRPEPQE